MSKVGMEVCLNIQSLYKEIGEDLEFTTIEFTPSEDSNSSHEYYDLYNSDRVLACMDGEDVMVVEDYGDTLVLLNDNGNIPVKFELTLSEFKISAFY